MARERNWSVLLGAFGIGVVVAILLFMSMASAQTAARFDAEGGEPVSHIPGHLGGTPAHELPLP